MKILLLNQTFHPDVVATAQYASDLALKLRESGHHVTVIAGSHGYDNPRLSFPRRETWHGISIRRISMLQLGKSSRWRRAAAFASYLANCLFRMLTVGSHDVVIALTSPPLVSALGAFLVRLKGGRFVFWVMDLNPDEAIAAGWLRAGSRTGRLLQAILQFSLDRSHRLIALDRFMSARLHAKGVPEHKIAVIPPWSHDAAIAYDQPGRDAFRRRHGLAGKFVVMYSGNHSPCHPLDTLLQAARHLSRRDDIVFCFVGGGSEYRKITTQAGAGMPNVLCLPYQPLDRLSASLSAADLHAVVMGDPFVGIVHPCKVYNIERLGIPYIYIGPDPSHITERNPQASFRHGEVEKLVAYLESQSTTKKSPKPPPTSNSQQTQLNRMLEAIENPK